MTTTRIPWSQPPRTTSLPADTHKIKFVADMWNTTLNTLSARAPTLLRAVTDEVARAVRRGSGTEVTVDLHTSSGYIGRIAIDGAQDKVSLCIHTALRGDGTFSTPASSLDTSGSEQAFALALAGQAGADFEKAFGSKPSGMRILTHANKTDKTLILDVQVPGIGAALRGGSVWQRQPAPAPVAPKQPEAVPTPKQPEAVPTTKQPEAVPATSAPRPRPEPAELAAGICDFSSLAKADAAMRKVLDGIPRGHAREDYRVAYRVAVAQAIRAAPLPEWQKLDLLEINARYRAQGS